MAECLLPNAMCCCFHFAVRIKGNLDGHPPHLHAQRDAHNENRLKAKDEDVSCQKRQFTMNCERI